MSRPPTLQLVYVQGLDTTDADMLIRTVTQALQAQGFAAERLRDCYDAHVTAAAKREDFAQARLWGDSSSLALLMRDGDAVELVVDGFTKADALLTAIDRVAQGRASA